MSKNSTTALIELIKEWMINHKNEYIPSFRELTKNAAYHFYTLPCYSECKNEAFSQLQDEGYILGKARVDKSFKAKIIGYNPNKSNTYNIVDDGMYLMEETVQK